MSALGAKLRTGVAAHASLTSEEETSKEPAMTQRDLFRPTPKPWNRGRIIGPKPPFKAKHVWAIHQQLKVAGRARDLALFDCGIDAKSPPPLSLA